MNQHGLEKLRRMADQIGANFASNGHDHAVFSTADHIWKYWDPRMKAAIFADDRSLLNPIAGEAIEILAQGIKPTPPPADRVFNRVDEVGHSDAG